MFCSQIMTHEQKYFIVLVLSKNQSIIWFIINKINLDEFIKIDIIKFQRNSCLSISCLCGICYVVEYIFAKWCPFSK